MWANLSVCHRMTQSTVKEVCIRFFSGLHMCQNNAYANRSAASNVTKNSLDKHWTLGLFLNPVFIYESFTWLVTDLTVYVYVSGYITKGFCEAIIDCWFCTYIYNALMLLGVVVGDLLKQLPAKSSSAARRVGTKTQMHVQESSCTIQHCLERVWWSSMPNNHRWVKKQTNSLLKTRLPVCSRWTGHEPDCQALGKTPWTRSPGDHEQPTQCSL